MTDRRTTPTFKPKVTPSTEDALPIDDLFLFRLRYREGRPVKLSGQKPLILDQKDTLWVICLGQADVFGVHVEDGQPSGPRRHLFRAESGCALFTPAERDDTLRLLLVGGQGTEVIRLWRHDLERLAKDPKFSTQTLGLVESWVEKLTIGAIRDVPPRDFVLVSPNQTLTLDEPTTIRNRKGVLWVKPQSPVQFANGIAEAGDVLPLTGDLWIQTQGAAVLESYDSKATFAAGELWAGLDQFTGRIMDRILSNELADYAATATRFQKRSTLDQLRLNNAFIQLAGILSPGRMALPLSRVGGDNAIDPLLAVCQLIGKSLGITIDPGPDDIARNARGDALQRITDAARVKVRQVALKGEWWREDSGPLLAYLEDGHKPVALLPTWAGGRPGYVIQDPSSPAPSQVRVNHTVAQRVEGFAWTFYRSFPERIIGARDMLRFGLMSCRSDLLTVVLMGGVVGAMGTIVPLFTGSLFDRVIPNAARNDLILIAFALITVALSSAMFNIVRNIAVQRVEGKLDASLQSALYDRLLDLPATFFRDYTSGDLGNRTLGITVIRQTLSRVAVGAALSSIFSLFSFGLLFSFDVTLALIATGLVGVLLAVLLYSTWIQMRTQRQLAEVQGDISGLVLQFLTGIAKFRVAGAEKRAFAMWAEMFTRQRALTFKIQIINNRLGVFNQLFSLLTSIVIFAVIGFGISLLVKSK